jgi:NADH:ubiquinone oxidoreductase subunit H
LLGLGLRANVFILYNIFDLMERHSLGGLHLRMGFSTNGFIGLFGLLADALKLIQAQIIFSKKLPSPFFHLRARE